MPTLTIGTGCMRHPTLAPGEVLPDTAQPRLDEAAALLSEAARRGCDILCLPELFNDPSQGVHLDRYAEPEDGPVMTWLATMARRHGLAIITSVALRHDGGIANTGVAFDRNGALVGRYRKVHLPPGEREMATAGDDFPVFSLAGVRVGMQICYDLEFPEGCRILALQGAELIVWPNMWGGMPEARTEVLMRARAMENSVYLVSSGYLLSGSPDFRAAKIFGRTCIIDREGVVCAEVGHRLGVAVATLDRADLAKPAAPDGTYITHRLPELYGALVRLPCPSRQAIPEGVGALHEGTAGGHGAGERQALGGKPVALPLPPAGTIG